MIISFFFLFNLSGSKGQKRESTNLKNYVVMSSTSAENSQSDNTSTSTL